VSRDASEAFFYSALDVKYSVGHRSTICTRPRTVQSVLITAAMCDFPVAIVNIQVLVDGERPKKQLMRWRHFSKIIRSEAAKVSAQLLVSGRVM